MRAVHGPLDCSYGQVGTGSKMQERWASRVSPMALPICFGSPEMIAGMRGRP